MTEQKQTSTPPQASPMTTEEVDWSTEPTAAYVTGAHIVHTPREFAMILTEYVALPGRGSIAPNYPEPRAKVAASVRMTPETFFRFVASCASNWNKFVQRYSDVHQTPRFQLIGGDGSFQLEGLEPPASTPNPNT